MEIIHNKTIYNIQFSYNRDNKEYYIKLNKSSGGLLYNVSIMDKHNVNKRLKELSINSSEINDLKTIYFDPASTYPRYKLRENSDLKKVLKIEKADAVISQNEYTYSDRLNPGLVFKDNFDNLYLINFFSIKYIKDKSFQENYENCKVLEDQINDYRTANNMELITDLKIIEKNGYIETNIKLATSLYNLFNIYTKIVLEKDIDLLINKNLLDMTNEEYDQINSMLSSTDENTVELGLNLLSGYNINDNICKIGTLIVLNATNIFYNKGSNRVGFQQIISTLNINKVDAIRAEKRIGALINYLKNLVELSNNEEDKIYERNCLLIFLKKELIDKYNELNSYVSSKDIKIKLELY